MSESRLRERALSRLGAGDVQRVTLQVRGEQVLVFAREGELATHCTCGTQGCVHVVRALAWMTGDDATGEVGGVRSSVRPPPPGAGGLLTREGAMELASALEDVLVAVVRMGVASGGGPSVRETLARVVSRAPDPLPAGLTRWLGRLEVSLVQHDLGTVARLLDGAARFASDLRASEPTEEQLTRSVAWLGTACVTSLPAARLTDRTLIEVGREHITGSSRRSLERRYLVDLQTGEVLREERQTGDEASLGPCPRALHVGLAEVEVGGSPRRVRLLQYAVAPEMTSEHYAALAASAMRRVNVIKEAYVEGQRAFPGVAEPFVLFAPADVAAPPLHEPRDQEGTILPLARAENASLAALIRRAAAGNEVEWLAGRVTDTDGTLMLRPVSLAVRGAAGKMPRLCRVA